MSLTLGFISIVISLIIPGIIFRRIYFFGEFSKQFSTKEPIHQVLLYSIIPGIIIQFSCIYFYSLFFDIDLTKVFNFHKTLFQNDNPIKENGVDLFTIIFKSYVPYTFCIYLISIIVPFLISRLIVRGFKLDCKQKFLRFKNQWYYIFSGEVFRFPKFKNNFVSEDIRINLKNHIITYVDILISPPSGKNQFYSGYLIDYELDPKDITKLDKLYLLKPVRYKKNDVNNNTSNSEENLENSEPSITNTIATKRIPGDIFVLSGQYISNINTKYIFLSPEEVIENIH